MSDLMSGTRSMHSATNCICALSLMLLPEASTAQTQPATIPTVVAQAMAFEPEMLGRPQYFDGRTPPDWPNALVPPGVRVIGGGVLGDSAMFRVQTAVFAFSPQSNPSEELRAILTRAGYTRHDVEPARRGGGFVQNEPSSLAAQYCNGSSMATFGPVDSVQAPLVIALQVVDGEAGRQNCSPQRDRAMAGHFPVAVPTLSPPKGAMQIGGGSSSSGTSGNMESTLRTTMPTDSVLWHYAAQLVAGGWTSDGRSTIANGIGVQRFSFTEGKEPWTAALIVMGVGDRHEVVLRVARLQ